MLGLLNELATYKEVDCVEEYFIIVSKATMKTNIFPFLEGEYVETLQLVTRDDETWLESCYDERVLKSTRVMLTSWRAR